MSHEGTVELALPFHIKPLGTVSQTTDRRTILSHHLEAIIHTGLRERVMRPEYGTTVWDMLFDPISELSMGIIEDTIRKAIDRYEPDVEVGEVSANPQGGGSSRVDIWISYRVRGEVEDVVTNLVSIDVGGDVDITTGVQP